MSRLEYYVFSFFANSLLFIFNIEVETCADPHIGQGVNVVLTNLSDVGTLYIVPHFEH